MTTLQTLTFTILSLMAADSLYAQPASKKDRLDSEDLYNKASVLFRTEKYEEAINNYKKAAELNPADADIFNAWGAALANSTENGDSLRLKEALDKTNISIRLNPESKTAMLNKAGMLSKLSEYTGNTAYIKESFTLYDTLRKRGHDNPNLYSNWATSLMSIGKKNNTLAQDEDKLALLFHKGYSVNNYSTYNMACMYALLGKKDLAIIWLDDAIISNDIKKSMIDEDSDFDNIRGDEEFIKLMAEHYTPVKEDNEYYYPDYGEKPFVTVEQMPQYPGGDRALMDFVKENLKIPEDGVKYGVNGIVSVRFVVDKDGSIKAPGAIRNIYNGKAGSIYVKEVIRIVRMMPKWVPGRQNGMAVPVYFTLPVRFKSDGEVEL